jgi:GT2 family glycosyltransferase
MLMRLDSTAAAEYGVRATAPTRGVDARLLEPTPPVSRQERHWAASILGDKRALRAWLERQPRIVDDEPHALVEHPRGINDTPLVGVVLLSHNDRDMVRRCLAAINRLTYRKGSYFVVLVENSTDPLQAVGADDIASAGYGVDVTLMHPERNTGFAAGVNLAARYAFERKNADHVLLLNDDALIPDTSLDLIQGLVAVTSALPDPAAVAPKVHYERHPAGPDVVMSAGGIFAAVPPEFGRRDPGLGGTIETDFVVGACMLITRRAWCAVGEFDARFFAYYEETEWCYRARQFGFWNYCVRDLRVLHGDREREYRRQHSEPAPCRLTTRNQVRLVRRHRWFAGVVAERLARKYCTLVERGEPLAAEAMVEGMVLARRNSFPEFTSGRVRASEIVARPAGSGWKAATRPAPLSSSAAHAC